MGNPVKPIVNLFEAGVDLIKGGPGPDTLKHFSADDIKTKKYTLKMKIAIFIKLIMMKINFCVELEMMLDYIKV